MMEFCAGVLASTLKDIIINIFLSLSKHIFRKIHFNYKMYSDKRIRAAIKFAIEPDAFAHQKEKNRKESGSLRGVSHVFRAVGLVGCVFTTLFYFTHQFDDQNFPKFLAMYVIVPNLYGGCLLAIVRLRQKNFENFRRSVESFKIYSSS